jgi:hypothetical protein
MIAKTFLLPKTFYAYSMRILREEKSLRDHEACRNAEISLFCALNWQSPSPGPIWNTVLLTVSEQSRVNPASHSGQAGGDPGRSPPLGWRAGPDGGTGWAVPRARLIPSTSGSLTARSGTRLHWHFPHIRLLISKLAFRGQDCILEGIMLLVGKIFRYVLQPVIPPVPLPPRRLRRTSAPGHG